MMITVTLSAKSARIAAMLAPRPWDADAGAVTFETRGRITYVTVRPDYTDRLIAQLEAARDFGAVKRIRAARADVIADAAERRADPDGLTYRERLAAVTPALTPAEYARRDGCPHPFRNGCPDGPWTCMTCDHREPGTCTSDHGPESR